MAFASALAIPICIVFFGYRIIKDKLYWREAWKLSEKVERGHITYDEYYNRLHELQRRYNR